MSSGSGPGRLPSLNSSAGKPSMKFKPNFVARRTKEEREASAPKLNADETPKSLKEKRKGGNDRRTANAGNQQNRMARYLNNTHVISSGPLAAGNFVSDKSSDLKRGFIKTEGRGPSLVQKGLEDIDNGDGDSLDEDDSGIEPKSKSKSKFNMGREYTVHEIQHKDDDDDEDADSGDNGTTIDEEAWQAKKVQELFPVRPIRIRHDDLDLMQKKIQESLSDVTSRETTPQELKTENDSKSQDLPIQKENNLQEKLNHLSLQHQFQSLDQNESLLELKSLNEDHLHIWKKLNKINNKPNTFMVFQLPSKLPSFEEILPKTELADDEDTLNLREDVEEKETEIADKSKDEEAIKPEKKRKTKKKDHTAVPQEALTGNIGSIRVHKSGKLSVKIGEVVMDISRGAETTFLQDVAALNQSGETPSVELLGRIDGRVVITPRFQ